MYVIIAKILIGGDLMSSEIENNLKQAIDMCKNDRDIKINNFSIVYPFTTENISQYINLFDLKGKSLLTVGSSGDQTINAILSGAKSITQLDINPFAKYYYYLKMASILCLDVAEVIAFFSYNDRLESDSFKNESVLSKKTFDKISSTLKAINFESYEFWNNLFKNYSSLDIRSHLFHRDNRKYTIKKCNLYLQSNELFEKTRSKIKKINPEFIDGDICNAFLQKEYDNIWLSNLASYLSKTESNKLLEKLVQHLSPDGNLLMEYIYIYRPYLIPKYKKMENYESKIITFDGCEEIPPSVSEVKDAVLIYKKTRNKSV